MSKRESISRYNLIIKKLRRYPATFKEISDYLSLESEIQSYNFNVSKRTFQRDLADIRTIYNIDIQFDFSRGVYFVDFDEQPEMNERILEAFDTFNALNISDRLSNHIHFEKRKPQGTENLYGLLHAIKNKVQIIFTHQKYWDNESTNRLVEPYALKEFKNRWYVLANDLKDNRIKSFALDRLNNLEITKRHFQFPKDFDVNEHYKYCFGIVSPNEQKPQEIILSFNTLQGKYIKSLPLHESQEIIKDDDNELRIKLFIVITFDFLMEILSHGDRVKVIEPDSLIANLKRSYQNALNRY
ncbi:MAG: WYL domain-containing protein [Bacteroidales bacterium]|nr:WYL domain-containing protein [Bacteroidales bacterium]